MPVSIATVHCKFFKVDKFCGRFSFAEKLLQILKWLVGFLAALYGFFAFVWEAYLCVCLITLP